jgi:2,4-dienoyl-CoA reductase-like NADH-dependent reductase (Old Yellow Enzyme family)
LTAAARRPRPVGALKTLAALREHVARLGAAAELELDDTVVSGADAPLAQPYRLRDGFVIGNRFCIHPMEGWDGSEDGRPSELTRRRWLRFGESGAKLIWGGEAVAVRRDGRANPNQLVIDARTVDDLAGLRASLVTAHERRFERSDDLLVGLQLTHSGRYSRPAPGGRPEPVLVARHPVLDRRLGLDESHALLDDEALDALVDDFVQAARRAHDAGFGFVDIKHCHGYLAHEILGAHTRPGRYGGALANRAGFLAAIVAGIRRQAPGLRIGVRLSAFDFVPFRRGPDGRGAAEEPPLPYRHGFGVAPGQPTTFDLEEPRALLERFEPLGIELVNVTAGSPYYNPHIQRPALYPPSDGYDPPNDPLIDVARQMAVTGALKRAFPRLFVVGSAWSYLQEWLPHAAQRVVRTGAADAVGLGRMVLSYPDLPADVLAGRPLDRQRICRTFSDCTTAPRNGMVSGCYPLDQGYKDTADAVRVRALRPRTGDPGAAAAPDRSRNDGPP